ncbi:MAG: alpha-1,2-fucosyltransferase [Polynucleobacter sp.]|nr:alpha-1,2-fucosyltransferase [Polynucleobacter sp.]
MIFLCLKGRFGNQLYQLGAALRLAKKNINLIKINLRYLPNPGDFRLNELLSKADLPEFITDAEMQLNPVNGKTYSLGDTPKGAFFDQPLLDAQIDLSSDHVVLDGYYQSGKNLAVLREFVYQAPVLSRSTLLSQIKPLPKETLVAHYRMGDYLKPDVQREIGLINLSYLDSSIEKLWDKKNELIIFSDGDEVRKRYENKNGIRVETGGSDIDTYRTMMAATTLIVPNSTFSLSAGFLSPVTKKICRPLIWSRKYLSDDLTQGIQPEVECISNTFYGF